MSRANLLRPIRSKNLLTGREEKPRQILEVFKHHNEQMSQLVGSEFSPGTMERYKTSLAHTRSFIRWKYGVEDMGIQKVDFEFVTEYEHLKQLVEYGFIHYVPSFDPAIKSEVIFVLPKTQNIL